MSALVAYILFGGLLMIGLGILSWIDAKTFRLPNKLTVPLFALGLGFSFAVSPPSLLASIIGAVIGYFSFVMLEYIFRKLYNKDGLGRGDAKLLAVGGVWCGWFGLPYILLIASLCGLVFTQMPSYKNKAAAGHPNIPFGPFLSLGIAAIWLGQSYFALR